MPNYRLVGIFVPSKQSHVIFEFVNIYKDKGLFRFLKLSDSSDLYYKNFERPFMQFSALGQRGNLYQYKNIAKNSNLKLLNEELKEIETLILNSGFLVKPDAGYEKYGNALNIQIIEFTTSKKRGYLISKNIEDRTKPLFDYDNKYLFVTINSGEIENDHYPIYEFLIENNSIVKKQKYFYDVAGIEGVEYSLLAPIAEIAILILSLLLFGTYKLIIKLRKSGKNKELK